MELKDILIIVKTYPEISRKYTETVCTAGILAETKELVRLYPVRYRYLTGKNKFSKYQWIKAHINKSNSDSRPESYRLTEGSIILRDRISPGKDWNERKKWILDPKNIYKSVEELHNTQEEMNISLGLVKPKIIKRFFIENKLQDEIQDAEAKKESIVNQLHMFEKKMDLEILPVRFVLEFDCDDLDCSGHKLSILDWEFGQLYRKLRNDKDCEEKIRKKIMGICGEKNDTYLVLGNMNRWRHIFCILGFFYPPKVNQLSLF